MNIGLVSKWIASGQAIVTRQLRSALHELGHETFVLARPGSGPRAQAAGAVDRSDPAWDQPGVTEASAHQVPVAEYEQWAREHSLDAIFFDENYQFDEVRSLRDAGIRTIGRFVWEYFSPEHAEPAKGAYGTIYSLTRAERDRYAELGIDSPYVQWGIHPELLGHARDRSGVEVSSGTPGREADAVANHPAAPGREADAVANHPAAPGREAEEAAGIHFYFPGSFLGRRKPVQKVIKAFREVDDERLRLVISAQVRDREERLRRAAERDPRVELELDDLPEAEHRARFAACDVCLAPTRWEGLGLPLYEAIGFGLPIITNDKPPMSELVRDGESGILVGSIANGTARSGITAWDPDHDDLVAAIARLADDGERARMSEGTLALREERSWERTVTDLGELLG